MKKIILTAIILIIAFSLFSEKVIDKIIAKVGRQVILKSELEEYKKYTQQVQNINDKMTDIDILNKMIESKLIVQKAEDEGYEVPAYKIRNIVDEQIDKLLTQYENEENLKKALKQSGMTLSELREHYSKMVRQNALKEQIIQNEINSKIYITEIELEEYYKEHKDELPQRPEKDKLGMIVKFIEPGKKTENRIIDEMKNILDKIRKGKSFAKLAEQYSDCPSASNGGDLGFFVKGTMVKPFEKVAFSLKPGEISDIVKTKFGYHIIKMEEKQNNEIRVRHILKKLEITDEDIANTVSEMKKVLKKLRNGAEFERMAREYSEDDSTATNGGVLGEFSPENYPEFVKDELKKLNEGEYTNLIREEDAVYIFTILDKIPERTYDFAEIKSHIRSIVRQKKKNELYENWVKDLMKENYIEVNLD